MNPLAKEEYEAEKERLDELSAQRADLELSLEELEKLRRELTETVEQRFEETFAAVEQALRRGRQDAVPGRRGPPAPDRARGRGRGAGHRGRASPRRQACHPPLAALGRREGARRDRLPVQPVPLPAEPVLPPRRGRSRARRHQHRPLHRSAAHLRRRGAVHRRHAPEAHDGGRRRALRRHDGDSRRVADPLAPPAARSIRRRDSLRRPQLVTTTG